MSEEKKVIKKPEDTKYCKDCIYYKRPKCRKTNNFTARKNTCEDWELDVKRQKRIENEKSRKTNT